MEISKLLGQADRAVALADDYAAKKTAAEQIWNGEFYISGENKQISWASQVWMTLGGAQHAGTELLQRLEAQQYDVTALLPGPAEPGAFVEAQLWTEA